MTRLMQFPEAVPSDPAVERWFDSHPGELGTIALQWFEVMRACGGDVRELLHDGQPTACVGDAAFCYIDAFKAHVNVGFYLGAYLADPGGLQHGEGKFMRHVKLGPGREVDAVALATLIGSAYADMKGRVSARRLQRLRERGVMAATTSEGNPSR